MEMLTRSLNAIQVNKASPSLSRLPLLFSRWARGLHGPRLLHSNRLPGSDLLSRLAWPRCHRQPGPEFSRPAHVQGLLRPRQLLDWSQRQSRDTLGQHVQQQVSGLMNYWQLFNYLDHVGCLLSHYELGKTPVFVQPLEHVKGSRVSLSLQSQWQVCLQWCHCHHSLFLLPIKIK